MNPYEQYALIKSNIKELETKEAELKEIILADLESKGMDKFDIGAGKFAVAKLKKWSYPEAVLELGEEFKAAKAKSESTGEATFTETASLRYVEAKL